MESLHQTLGEPFTWEQPRWYKRFFTLEAGDTYYATLAWRRPLSFTAIAHTADGQWEFDHKGLLQSRIPVREGVTKAELGIFLTRRYGGKLTLSGSESYIWKLSGKSLAESTWITTQGSSLLHCARRLGRTTKASLVIKPEATILPDLPLLVALDWYIRLMMFAFAGTVMA
jgi:hypothetical protein